MLVALATLVAAASSVAANQPGPAPGSGAWVASLEPEWSRPVGGRTGFVGVEEYGRCSVFVDNGRIEVVSPGGDVIWAWPFRAISRLLNPRDAAVSPDCDAIAVVGDASFKHALIARRDGTVSTLSLAATPSEARFDHDGRLVAVGTYGGAVHLYARDGAWVWSRQTNARIVQSLDFSDDNERITFSSWAGSGVVSVAGHVETSRFGDADPELDTRKTSRRIAVSEDGSRAWRRGDDAIECVDGRGTVLASIAVAPGVREVKVSRDFGQVLVVTEKDLHPVSVERYAIHAPCKPLSP